MRLEMRISERSLWSLSRYQCAIILNSSITKKYCWLRNPRITSAA
jgi:hypothetical protein